jgi:hypothetical protein
MLELRRIPDKLSPLAAFYVFISSFPLTLPPSSRLSPFSRLRWVGNGSAQPANLAAGPVKFERGRAGVALLRGMKSRITSSAKG